ncbi:MAG: DNA primase [Oceanobacter sp.]
MAGRIPQGFIDDLLARVDVVDVVDSRVKLKKAGKNYSACCPFHNENTPSFTVSREKQFYYCFGCGASGTALKFVMEYDGLNFPDAVEKLADAAGMEVPRESNPVAQQREREQSPLYERMLESTAFYTQQLRQHSQRQKAVDYLKGRGLSGKAARFFEIGYAPPGWDNLQTALATDKDRTKQLISCGMLIEKEDGRTYDRFRDRIMFPIRDIRGRVIAFGGRVLGDEKPKYLNSPETPIFQKNRELYGLYEARKIRQKLVRLVIVEGYMDVVALAEHGIHYAVATLGTATSEHHLVRLFKLVPEVIFCFDGDQAGKNAAARAMETVLPILNDGVQARFLFLPDGEDPDSLVRQEGKAAFEERLNKSQHLPEFLFDHVKAQVDFDSLDGKARFDKLAAPLIARVPTGTLRDLMVAELNRILGVESNTWQQLSEQQQQQPEELPTQDSQYSYRTTESPGSYPEDHLSIPTDGYDNAYANEPEFDDSDYAEPQTAKVNEDLARAVFQAIQALVRSPSLATDLELGELEAETEHERLLIEIINKLKEAPQSNSIGLLMQWIGSPYHSQLTAIANEQRAEVAPVSAHIRVALNGMQIRQIDALLAELRALNQDTQLRKSMTPEQRQQLQSLQRQRKELMTGRATIYKASYKARKIR